MMDYLLMGSLAIGSLAMGSLAMGSLAIDVHDHLSDVNFSMKAFAFSSQ